MFYGKKTVQNEIQKLCIHQQYLLNKGFCKTKSGLLYIVSLTCFFFFWFKTTEMLFYKMC